MAFDAGAVTGEIILRYDKAMGALKAVEKGTQSAMTRMSKSVEKHQAAIRGLGIALVAVGAATALLAKSVVGAAGQMERYQAQFEVLTGSAEAAQDRLQKLVAFAAKTPFDLPGIIEADKLILAFGLDLGGLEETLTQFGDTAAAMGVPIEQVIRNFAKLQAGMFDMAEMAPLGITRDRLREFGVEFSKTGEVINREDLFPAAIKLIEKFAGTMDKVSLTTEGRLSNLGDAFFQLKASFGEAIAPMAREYIEKLTSIVETTQRWIVVNPELAKSTAILALKIGLVSAAVGALLILLPKLIASLVVLGGVLTGPVGIVVAVAAVTAGLWAGTRALDAYYASASKFRELAMLGGTPRAIKAAREAATDLRLLSDAQKEYNFLKAMEGAGTLSLLGGQSALRASLRNLTYAQERYARSQERTRQEIEKADEVIKDVDDTVVDVTGSTKALATRLEEATKEVKDLRSEVARLPAGTTVWADATKDLNEALAVLKEMLSAASSQGEVYLSFIDRIYVALGQVKVEQKLRLWRQEQDGLTTATSAFGTVIQTVMATTEMALKATTEAAKRLRAALMYEAIEVPATVIGGESAEETMLRLKKDIAAATPGTAEYEEALAAYEAFMAKYRGDTKAGTDDIGKIWRHTFERIQDAFADAIYGMMTSASNFGDFLKGVWDAILQTVAQIVAKMVADFVAGEKAKQKEIQKTQAMMLATGGGGWASWIAMAIPFLQEGAIVTKPTVAMIGERGPEAVIPLGRSPLSAGMAPMGALAGGGGVTVMQNLSVDSLDELSLRRLARRSIAAVGFELWRARLRTRGGIG